MAHSRKLLELIISFALAISLSVPARPFDETHLKKLKAINKRHFGSETRLSVI